MATPHRIVTQATDRLPRELIGLPLQCEQIRQRLLLKQLRVGEFLPTDIVTNFTNLSC
jgi:hypothetical protein